MKNFVAGILTGVAIGILLAPDKGSKTRQKLADKAEDLKSDFADFIDNASQNIQSAAEDLMRKGKKKADDFAKNAAQGM